MLTYLFQAIWHRTIELTKVKVVVIAKVMQMFIFYSFHVI